MLISLNLPSLSLPIAKGTVFSKTQSPNVENEINEMQMHPYTKLLGCLSFLAGYTRPDKAYAVNTANSRITLV